jgi:hypothetical protein
VPRRALEQTLDVDLIAICHEIEAEIVDVFERKFGISPAETLVHLRLYLAPAVYVEIDGTEQGCRDAEDDIILECAKERQSQPDCHWRSRPLGNGIRGRNPHYYG